MDKNTYISAFNSIPVASEIEIKFTKDFISCSKRDLEVAEILYMQDYYEHSIYFLQQSVEKIIKAYLIYMGNITKNELKELNHKSPKAFLMHLDANWVNQVLDSTSKLFDSNLEQDKEFLKKKLKEPYENYAKLSKDFIIKFINEYKKISNAEKEIIKPEVVQEFEDFLVKTNNIDPLKLPKIDLNIIMAFSRGFKVLLPLSFVTFVHQAFTRYPDGMIKPSDYNKELGIVQSFLEIKEEVHFSINALEGIINYKPNSQNL